MDNELDEGMVEKARAAFEAMTKAMLDAGRRCDHDHDDGLGMLTARDIPTAAGVPALLAEVERLRAEVAAGIETVARDLRSLLAGSGEQPGEADRAYAEGRWCGECRYGQVEDPPCCARDHGALRRGGSGSPRRPGRPRGAGRDGGSDR